MTWSQNRLNVYKSPVIKVEQKKLTVICCILIIIIYYGKKTYIMKNVPLFSVLLKFNIYLARMQHAIRRRRHVADFSYAHAHISSSKLSGSSTSATTVVSSTFNISRSKYYIHLVVIMSTRTESIRSIEVERDVGYFDWTTCGMCAQTVSVRDASRLKCAYHF